MSTVEVGLRPQHGEVNQEPSPMRRTIQRQNDMINELTARADKLQAETNQQAEMIGLLQDERDDARAKLSLRAKAHRAVEVQLRNYKDETEKKQNADWIRVSQALAELSDARDKLDNALYTAQEWKTIAKVMQERNRTETERLSKALAESEEKVKPLEEENLRLTREMLDDRKVYNRAFGTLVHAKRLEEAAFGSARKRLGDRMGSTGPELLLYETGLLATMPRDADPIPPAPLPCSQALPLQRRYTIEQLKAWEPAVATEQKHGNEVATAIWKSHSPRNEQQVNVHGVRNPLTASNKTMNAYQRTLMATQITTSSSY